MADEPDSSENFPSSVQPRIDHKYSDPQAHHYAMYSVMSEILTEPSDGNQSKVPQDWESSWLQKICCSLPPEQENLLNLFLIRRLKKGAIYTNTGAFSGMDFSVSGSSPAVCYYVLLPSRTLVCIISEAETNLEVFRPELAKFCEELDPYIQDPVSVHKLSKWNVSCLQYISNILKLFGSQIATLFQLVQCNGDIKVEGAVPLSVHSDLHQFLMACSVAECFVGVPECSDSSLKVYADSNGKLCLEGLEANSYCMEWAHLLLEMGPTSEPWRLRKLLEAFKLKTIKDMNVLKRLLKQAETDHYYLYRAYTFLWQSGNSDMLLRQAAVLEGSSSHDMLSVLENHIKKTAMTSLSESYLK